MLTLPPAAAGATSLKDTHSLPPLSQAVHAFLHGRLVGEGNLLRHLDLLGYKLSYRQSPLAEYPYRVGNLAVDLRDGLRLVRAAELLTGKCALYGVCMQERSAAGLPR